MKKLILLTILAICAGQLYGMEKPKELKKLPEDVQKKIRQLQYHIQSPLQLASLRKDVLSKLWSEYLNTEPPYFKIIDNEIMTESPDGRCNMWDLMSGRSKEIFCISDDVEYLEYDPFKDVTLNNPFVWIIEKANVLQLDFIKRAIKSLSKGKSPMIALPEEFGKMGQGESQEQIDGNIYFSFPDHMRRFLRDKLKIRSCVISTDKAIPSQSQRRCLIQ